MGSSISIVTKYDLSQFEEGVLTENILAVVKKINRQLPGEYKLEPVAESLKITEVASVDENLIAYKLSSNNPKVDNLIKGLDSYIYVYR